MASARNDIRALTGIRGVAAIWVAVYHFWFQQPWSHGEQSAGLKALLAHGYLAVDLFFILSGFVMAMSYGHFFNRPSWGKYGIFLTRRFARIYPLYITVLLLLFAYVGARHLEFFTPRQIVSNLLMIQSWGIDINVVNQSWSLSVELIAYLTFPALFFLFCKSQWTIASMLFSLCVCAIVYIAVSSHVAPVEYRGDLLNVNRYNSFLPILRCMSEFSIGLLVYRMASFSQARRLADDNSLATGAALFLIALASFYRLDVIFVLCAAAVLFFLSGNNMPARLLGTPFFFFLGNLSYSMYLVHSEIIEPIGTMFGDANRLDGFEIAAYFCLYMSITLVFSWFLHHAVERPGRRILRNVEFTFSDRAETAVRQSESRGVAEVADHPGSSDMSARNHPEGTQKAG